MRKKIWNTFSLSARLQKFFGLIPLPDFLNCLKAEWVMNLTLPKDNQQISKEEASNFIVFVAIYCDTIWMTKNPLIRQNDKELLYL